jgi:twitching motility protein PilT
LKPIEDLLKNLARPEVLEFGLVTNRLPSVNIGGKFEPVDDEAPTTEKLLGMLVAMGGSRYVEALSDKPVQWTTRLDGVGVIAVAAIMRKDVVQARFTVARRDPPGGRASMPPQPVAAAGQSPSQQKQSAAPPARSQPQQQIFATTVQGQGPGGGPSPPQRSPLVATAVSAAAPAVAVAPQVRAQAQSQPQQQPARPSAHPAASSGQQPVAKPSQAPSATAKAAPAAAAPAQQSQAPVVPPPPPPQDEWEDDDEPTVQTLSPPVQQPPNDPRPKPARKPDAAPAPQVSRDTGPLASAAPQSPSGPPRTERGMPPDLEERKDPPPAAEARAPEPARPVGADQTLEQRPGNKERPSDRGIEKRPSVAPPAAAPAVQAAPVAARPQPAPQQPSPPPPLVVDGPRRINTPTSVDAVDVEITTSDHGSPKKPPLVLDLEADREATVEVTPAQVIAKQSQRPMTGAMPSAVPSTAPSAVDKDRPRVDGGLDAFLQMATATRATDMHLIAGRPLLLRVATDLLPRTQPVAVEVVERIAREIVPARLREQLEQDGSCEFTIDHPAHGRFRANVSRQRSGYKISARVIPRDVPTIPSLGLPAGIATATAHQQGLVLVTGPAGNGKTSTVAALVDHLNAEAPHHILTIEDPIEFIQPRKRALVSHREVGSSARSYASALKAAMREDPDVIVVGELRDAATVRLAISAAETGHLVLATMNTPSAAKTIDRLIDLFPPAEQAEIRMSIAGALRMIIGQRLVPSADRTRLHVAVELLPATIALYTLIRDGRTFQIPSLQQRGRALGVLRLDESLADLVRAQKATLEVVKQFAESPADLEALVARAPSIPPRKA